jgi:hypothetical protein
LERKTVVDFARTRKPAQQMGLSLNAPAECSGKNVGGGLCSQNVVDPPVE